MHIRTNLHYESDCILSACVCAYDRIAAHTHTDVNRGTPFDHRSLIHSLFSFSLFNMTGTYRLQLSLLIITYVIFSSLLRLVHTIEYGKHSHPNYRSFFFLSTSVVCLQLAVPKINQKILIGPEDINAHPGETVQFPCLVSKQSDAIVTWCWNDFCTLGKTQLLRQETTSDGRISIYQYTAYPRFQLYINERLSMYNRLISFSFSPSFILLIIFFSYSLLKYEQHE